MTIELQRGSVVRPRRFRGSRREAERRPVRVHLRQIYHHGADAAGDLGFCAKGAGECESGKFEPQHAASRETGFGSTYSEQKVAMKHAKTLFHSKPSALLVLTDVQQQSHSGAR